MIMMIYDLDSEINGLLRSQKTSEDIKRFKEGIKNYIHSKEEDIVVKMLERIYNNDIEELRHDLKKGELAKILMLIKSDEPVDVVERRKMFGILYPMLKEELGGLEYRDLFAL